MIAGTLEPSHGSYRISGRVSALLELGAGFNPEFTGRENVLLNGSLLGIYPEEMETRLPAILEFSELGDFIDKPVKTYSSGMFVRLAFSVAVHVEPEVLLVDEALSVGDAAFQYKCMERIRVLRSRGMSILFVTHDTGAVRKICDRAFWLDSGRLIASGNATAISDDYDSFMRAKSLLVSQAPEGRESGSPDKPLHILGGQDADCKVLAVITGVSIKDRSGVDLDLVCMGGEIRVSVGYEVRGSTSGLIVGVAIFRNDGLYVAGLNTGLDDFVVSSDVGFHSITLTVPNVNLLGGEYFCKVGLFDATGMVKWDFWDAGGRFKVFGPYLAEGVVVPEHTWEMESQKERGPYGES
jgi:ABC-type polysaccharide/polyol phosphate transport system ATPase subunit